MVFSPALERFLCNSDVSQFIDVLEIEPQTMWLADHPIYGPFTTFEQAFENFHQHGKPALVHSVGMPLGGTRPPSQAQLTALKCFCDRVQPPWVSEHLSVAGTPHRSAGFLLPPLQTQSNVEIVGGNVQALSDAIRRPVALETGVAYLRRKKFEMDDCEFLSNIVEENDCGILLDINNLYCNHKNGRIRIDKYLDRIPIDRVWEVHIAGSDIIDGFTVDAHNGPMNDEQRALAREIVPHLTNVGAITSEIYGTFLQSMSLPQFERIVLDVKDLWSSVSTRPSAKKNDFESSIDTIHIKSHDYSKTVSGDAQRSTISEWETNLTNATITGDTEDLIYPEDLKAVKLYSSLARSFRASILIRNLPRTFRYLILAECDTDELLANYFLDCAPQIYGPIEAEQFRCWMSAHMEDNDTVDSLLNYDLAVTEAKLNNNTVTVSFKQDPRLLFEALSNFELPNLTSNSMQWDIEIVPD